MASTKATGPTGIAGAQDYQPKASGARACWVCGNDANGTSGSSFAARTLPGVGIIQACSDKCRNDPKFDFVLTIRKKRKTA